MTIPNSTFALSAGKESIESAIQSGIQAIDEGKRATESAVRAAKESIEAMNASLQESRDTYKREMEQTMALPPTYSEVEINQSPDGKMRTRGSMQIWIEE